MGKIGRVTGGEKEEGQGWEEGERLVWKKGWSRGKQGRRIKGRKKERKVKGGKRGRVKGGKMEWVGKKGDIKDGKRGRGNSEGKVEDQWWE